MSCFKNCFLAILLAILGDVAPAFADVEKPEALDGSTYAVITPVYDGSSGASSFLRLFNGGTAATTFNVTIVNAANGITLGAAPIQVPANASPQYAMTPTGGANSIFAQAGVSASSTQKYALYIQNTDTLTGYQHVIYAGASQLFVNNSVCTTPMSQQLASSSKQVLTDLFTTQLAALAPLPTVVTFHNTSASQVIATVRGYDSNSGTLVGQYNQTIGANASVTLTQPQLEQSLGFFPSSSQFQMNIVVTNSTGGTLPVRLTNVVQSAAMGGEVNLSEICAMNAVPATVVQVAPSVPVAYCGTLSEGAAAPFPYNLLQTSFTASVAPSGKIRLDVYGVYGTFITGAQAEGSVSGTTLSMTTSSGNIYTGTIQNGVFTATNYSQIGTSTLYGNTTACN